MVDKCTCLESECEQPTHVAMFEQIINNTFKPLMPSNEEVPAELAPKLIHRFMSNEGYELQPGASEILRHLRESPKKSFDQIVVGIITNSDPRVPDVLSSLGLRINPLRYGATSEFRFVPGETWDIDFSVMSYDVGKEKPNKEIFKAATEMLDSALTARGDTSTSRDLKAWEKVYVGDEYDKDVVGAGKSGWYSVLISEEAVYDDQGNDLIGWLEDEPVDASSSLMQVFHSGSKAVGFGSLFRIGDWLQL